MGQSPFNPAARPEFPWPGDMASMFDPDAPPGILANGVPGFPPAQQPAPPAAPPAALQPAPQPQAIQLDRYGRNPEDVRAMLTERARQQYERRFGSFAPGENTASMASQGRRQDLDSLIGRLNAAQMNNMASRRAGG